MIQSVTCFFAETSGLSFRWWDEVSSLMEYRSDNGCVAYPSGGLCVHRWASVRLSSTRSCPVYVVIDIVSFRMCFPGFTDLPHTLFNESLQYL